MGRKALLPDIAEVALQLLQATGTGGIVVVLQARREQVSYPGCGAGSKRVHSRYLRKVADLPWEGIAVTIRLQTRKFFCATDGCSLRIFTEPLPNTVGRYARRTRRAAAALDWITLALRGEAGARLAQRLGLSVAGSTLLRQVRHRIKPLAATAPRVLGIDDWAWRKGHRYGMILCDLERHSVVDLLPDREAESVELWLRAHPGTEIVSRDRASAYADAARKAAPGAVQVADRWHLLRNLSEALKHSLESHHRMLAVAARNTQRTLGMAEDPLQHAERPLHLRPHPRLGPVPALCVFGMQRFQSGGKIGHRAVLPPLGHRLRVDAVAAGQRSQARLTMLYRSTDRRCRRGAPV